MYFPIRFKTDPFGPLGANLIFPPPGSVNTRVYPSFAPLSFLGPSPYINTLDLEAISVLPIPTSHTIVSLVICHHIHQNQPREPSELWYRFHYHRGLAIQELGRKIAGDTQCESDTTVFGIISTFPPPFTRLLFPSHAQSLQF